MFGVPIFSFLSGNSFFSQKLESVFAAVLSQLTFVFFFNASFFFSGLVGKWIDPFGKKLSVCIGFVASFAQAYIPECP